MASDSMSFTLINEYTGTCRTFSRQFLTKALELAGCYGWQPMGTRLPLGHDFLQLAVEWDGSYLTNDGQTVRAEDAAALSTALAKSLDDIPDENPSFDWRPELWKDDDLPEWLTPEERYIIVDGLQAGLLDIVTVAPIEYFRGDEKQTLRRFIRFCGLGSFEIT